MQSADAPRIVIVTGSSLARNPRVVKEAQTLCRAGFQVAVINNSTYVEQDLDLASKLGFRTFSVRDRGAGGWRRWIAAQSLRAKTRAARGLNRRLRIESRWQLAGDVSALFRWARDAAADYCIVHQEPGLWVGCQLLRSGLSAGVDIEDWYSEDLLPEARRHRPLRLLRRLEQGLLGAGPFASCPSRAMSRALAAEFGCRPPAVIYNAFPWAERDLIDGLAKDRGDRRYPSIHWFSQTVGPGRGIEDLLAALPLLEHPAEVHLRGHPVAGFAEWLTQRAPGEWRERIFLHGLVSNRELLSRIAEHDIGFAGEMKFCRSRDLTVTNKILQYLLAGLAVVASDTAGQREVAQQAGEAVLLYPSGDAAALAARLDALLGAPERLARAKAAALKAAETTFCWERQEPVLLEAVNRAVSRRAAGQA